MTLPAGWEMEHPAILSPDGRYRYWLRRQVNMTGSGMAVFCMLNPSTADATEDDPTIRRCIAYARSWGAADLGVVNLFALRATDPAELFRTGVADPEGPGNNDIIAKAADMARPGISGAGSVFVCAWGSHGRTPWQKKFMRERIEAVRGIVSDAHCTPTYLRVSEKTGQPWHPLYLPAVLTPKPWPVIPAKGGAPSNVDAAETLGAVDKAQIAPTTPVDSETGSESRIERCHADRDGDCVHPNCPQNRDGEPARSGRSCTLLGYPEPE